SFFFSSRRRHTRWPRDWSSDVCSSDLYWPCQIGWRIANWLAASQPQLGVHYLIWQGQYWSADTPTWVPYRSDAYGCPNPVNVTRSEERRVGKECRSRLLPCRERKRWRR